MNAYLRFLGVFLLAFVALAAVPRVTSVEPAFGKHGDQLVINGQNLDKATVTKLFLTASGEDHEVPIKNQTGASITFVIPAKLALGSYNVTVQTGGDAPSILEQPVSCSVVDEEGAKKMAESEKKQDVEIIEQQPEEPAPPQKPEKK